MHVDSASVRQSANLRHGGLLPRFLSLGLQLERSEASGTNVQDLRTQTSNAHLQVSADVLSACVEGLGLVSGLGFEVEGLSLGV